MFLLSLISGDGLIEKVRIMQTVGYILQHKSFLRCDHIYLSEISRAKSNKSRTDSNKRICAIGSFAWGRKPSPHILLCSCWLQRFDQQKDLKVTSARAVLHTSLRYWQWTFLHTKFPQRDRTFMLSFVNQHSISYILWKQRFCMQSW